MKTTKAPEGKLLAAVRVMLLETAVPSLDIYAATGIPPNQQWAIRAGKTKNPGVNKIERLYTFLTGEELDV